MAACPPPSASDAISDGRGSHSNQDGTEGGNISDDARMSTAASRCPGASAVNDNNESDDGASSRPSDEDEDDEDEGSGDGAKAEAVANSAKKPVDKSKWGCLGQVLPVDKCEVKHSKRSGLSRWCFIVPPAPVLLGVLSFFRAVSFFPKSKSFWLQANVRAWLMLLLCCNG